MKSYPEISDRTDDVYKFIFLAGITIFSGLGVNIFDIKNLIIDSSPVDLSAIIFIIGCIYYISKFYKICNMPYAAKYFSCESLGELSKLPCFILALKCLSDDCCRYNYYTVTSYIDGSTSSNKCCNHMWNSFILVIKRLAIILPLFSIYIFLLFYLIFLLIAKCIYLLVLECKRGEVPIEQKPEPQPPVDITNMSGNQNGIENIDKLNSNRKITEKPNYDGNQAIIQNHINIDIKVENTNIIRNNDNITNNVINNINNI